MVIFNLEGSVRSSSAVTVQRLGKHPQDYNTVYTLIWVLASNKKTNQNPKQTKKNPRMVFHINKKLVLTNMKLSKSLDFLNHNLFIL